MSRGLGAGSGGEDPRPLQGRFRLNEIDRASTSLRFRLSTIRWLILPVLTVAMVGMVVGVILGIGSTGPLVGGVVATLGGVAGIAQWARTLRDDLDDLREERSSLAKAIGAGAERAGTSIPPFPGRPPLPETDEPEVRQ